jgi:hypothetical protein
MNTSFKKMVSDALLAQNRAISAMKFNKWDDESCASDDMKRQAMADAKVVAEKLKIVLAACAAESSVNASCDQDRQQTQLH